MSKQWFKWTVEFQVHRTWVEDGFELTEERAKDWIEHDLGFSYPWETKAQVLSMPDPEEIAKAQGYASLADRIARDPSHADRLRGLATMAIVEGELRRKNA